MQNTGDKTQIKAGLVSSFTDDRTESLRDMTPIEYTAMCDSLDTKTIPTQHHRKGTSELKAQRSAVLHRLQKMGVDTSDWSKVDNFCLNNRIAGKKFYEITLLELKELIPKLISIAKKPKQTRVA